MQDGDLSNEVAPRLMFVFEGVVGQLRGPAAELREKGMLRLHRWAKAVECWEIPDVARAVLWDAAWRYSYRFDIVTHRPAGFAKALVPLLDEADIPYTQVRSWRPDVLARRMVTMPELQAVYFADPANRFTYGGRGVFLPEGLTQRLC